jgi:hypothetical protein
LKENSVSLRPSFAKNILITAMATEHNFAPHVMFFSSP